MPAADLRGLTLAFTAGVLILHALPALPGVSLLALLAASVLWPWRGRALWGAAVLGLLYGVLHAHAALAERWPPTRHGEERWVQGVVASLPERHADPRGEGQTLRFAFAPDDAALPRKLRVSWYRSEAVVRGGECWRLRLKLRSPHGSLNPGGFDYEAWLLREGVGGLATVREAEACGVAPGYPLLRLRQALVDRLVAALDGHSATALLVALTVGDASGLSDADWDIYRRTGTTHLVAISGLNLAVVAGFAFLLLRWGASLCPPLCLRVPAQRIGLVGAALLAAAYAALSGFEPPVVRALIMLLVFTLAALRHRLRQPSRALAWAWGLILANDPLAVGSPGLWLSFGAVAAILYGVTARWRVDGGGVSIGLRLQLFLSLEIGRAHV